MTRDSEVPWDDDEDDLDSAGESVLDAFDDYVAADPEDGVGFIDPAVTDDEWNDEVQTLLFTATNPARTVSVTSLISGQPVRVDLEPQVSSMTERQLGEEIAVVAALARQQALASQHVLIGQFLGQLGHDPVATRGFLERDLGLPSPEAVREERARVFASRPAD